MNWKKTAAWLLITLLIAACLPGITWAEQKPEVTLPPLGENVAAYDPENPGALTADQLYAESCILMNQDDGRVLFEKNADAQMNPASCTKIMTLLLAAEYGNLYEIVRIPESAADIPQDSSKIPVTVGEEMTFQDLLYGFMLRSGNDGANAIATIVSGSVDAFVARMNERAQELMKLVGIDQRLAKSYPHELDGGRRQRIGFARALALNPEFIVCDEPVSALDVSIQAQIMNLLMNLQRERNLTMLFIAHDLAMVKHISDNIGVMYLGKLVEISPAAELYENPYHPYTQALLESIPIADPDIAKSRGRHFLTGDVPSPIDPPKGCRFCGRCSKCMDICNEVRPELKEVSKGHQVACHLYD